MCCSGNPWLSAMSIINKRFNARKGNPVQFRYLYTAAVLAIAAMLAPPGSARAETVLYGSAGFIQGQQSFTESFNITTPGTLTVTLSSVPWLDAISDLNVFLTSATGIIAPAMAPGSETIQVQPGTVYAHWFGDADGVYKVGAYSLAIDFQPSTIPVSLPNGLILMLSGLGLFLILQPIQGTAPRMLSR